MAAAGILGPDLVCMSCMGGPLIGGRATAGCLAPPFPLAAWGGRTTEKESGDMSVMDWGRRCTYDVRTEGD